MAYTADVNRWRGPAPQGEEYHRPHMLESPWHPGWIAVTPASHFSAPECEKEKGKPDRPPDDEAQDGHGNPAGVPGRIEHMRAVGLTIGAAPSIDICGVSHFPLHDGITPL